MTVRYLHVVRHPHECECQVRIQTRARARAAWPSCGGGRRARHTPAAPYVRSPTSVRLYNTETHTAPGSSFNTDAPLRAKVDASRRRRHELLLPNAGGHLLVLVRGDGLSILGARLSWLRWPVLPGLALGDELFLRLLLFATELCSSRWCAAFGRHGSPTGPARCEKEEWQLDRLQSIVLMTTAGLWTVQ